MRETKINYIIVDHNNKKCTKISICVSDTEEKKEPEKYEEKNRLHQEYDERIKVHVKPIVDRIINSEYKIKCVSVDKCCKYVNIGKDEFKEIKSQKECEYECEIGELDKSKKWEDIFNYEKVYYSFVYTYERGNFNLICKLPQDEKIKTGQQGGYKSTDEYYRIQGDRYKEQYKKLKN